MAPVDSGGVSCRLKGLVEPRTYLICTYSIDPELGFSSESVLEEVYWKRDNERGKLPLRSKSLWSLVVVTSRTALTMFPGKPILTSGLNQCRFAVMIFPCAFIAK